MKWQTDTSKAKLNDWHICYDAKSGKKFSAMPVLLDGILKWLVDPWCRADKEQLLVGVTHFQYYPEDPVL